MNDAAATLNCSAAKITRLEKAALAICCLTLAALQGALAWNSSYVFNENGRIASGLMKLKHGDFSSFRVNPPLSDCVGAAPALFGKDVYSSEHKAMVFAPYGRLEYQAGEAFVRETPSHRLYLRLGRLATILFSLAGVFVCFFYGRFLFGSWGGLVAAFLWTFSPYVLGYGSTIGADVPSAVLALSAVGVFHYWLKTRSALALPLFGVTLGIAQLCKFTLLALYPLVFIMWTIDAAVRRLRKRTTVRAFFVELRDLLVWGAGVSLLLINMGYLFGGTCKPLGEYPFRSRLLSGLPSPKESLSNTGNRFSDTTLGLLPVPLPEDYLLGIDAQRLDFERGLPSYRGGVWSARGWFSYYCYALALKLPLGVLALSGLAFGTFLFKRGRGACPDELVLWGTFFFLFLLISSQKGFSTHSRYILPALPFLFVAIGRLGANWNRARSSRFLRAERAVVAVLCAQTAFSCLASYPNAISYFNALTPIAARGIERPLGPEPRASTRVGRALERFDSAITSAAPCCLLDSNLDWGQDAYRLDAWVKGRDDVQEMKVCLWSNGDDVLKKTSPIYKTRVDAGKSPWLALSVNYLFDEQKNYRWLWEQRPVAVVGRTIYVYRLATEDDDSERAVKEPE